MELKDQVKILKLQMRRDQVSEFANDDEKEDTE